MPWARRQLFEFNDLHWVPASLRDTVIETLGRTLDWAGIVAAVTPDIERFCADAGTTEILDLCGGSGVPAKILCREFDRRDSAVQRVVVTDLYPRVPLWTRERAAAGSRYDFVAESLDATAIPSLISAGRTRVILNAFHHFPAPLAIAILRDAVSDRAPIFIAEPFHRTPSAMGRIAVLGLPALLATPVLSPRSRLAKALWTWATPIAAMVGVWDGLVSTLREWNEDELRAMVAPFGADYEWRFGTYAYALGGRGTWFSGRPRLAGSR